MITKTGLRRLAAGGPGEFVFDLARISRQKFVKITITIFHRILPTNMEDSKRNLNKHKKLGIIPGFSIFVNIDRSWEIGDERTDFWFTGMFIGIIRM